jgi:hypothetical protein
MQNRPIRACNGNTTPTPTGVILVRSTGIHAAADTRRSGTEAARDRRGMDPRGQAPRMTLFLMSAVCPELSLYAPLGPSCPGDSCPYWPTLDAF